MQQSKYELKKSAFFGTAMTLISTILPESAKTGFKQGTIEEIYITWIADVSVLIIFLVAYSYYTAISEHIEKLREGKGKQSKAGRKMNNNHVCKLLSVLVFVMCLLLPSLAFAAVQTVEADGCYAVGDGLGKFFRGAAYCNLGYLKAAKRNFAKAYELEPDNNMYRENKERSENL